VVRRWSLYNIGPAAAAKARASAASWALRGNAGSAQRVRKRKHCRLQDVVASTGPGERLSLFVGFRHGVSAAELMLLSFCWARGFAVPALIGARHPGC
jgi:hypothetical protein